MGALLFIFCLVLGFATGYLYRDTFGRRKQKQVGGDNSVQIQIQTDEILLDADTNKEISDITSSNDTSPKNRLLNELTIMINEAAQNGQCFLNLDREYGLNKKIETYLTRNEIKEYFESRGYRVKFIFQTLDYSDIERISWE